MKIAKSSVSALLAAVASSTLNFSSAFVRPSTSSSASTGRSLAVGGGHFVVSGRRSVHSLLLSSNPLSRVASTAGASSRKPIRFASPVTMFFGNLFGMTEPKIDYEGLDHPGPELAAMAKEDGENAASHSRRDPNLALATFGGGCFWGLELAYQRVPGVVYTAVGYAQGTEKDPTYGQVCSGATGHTEAVMVYYDPKECTYDRLLDAFFAQVDPTTVNGQGNDFGRQYRTGVYFHTPEQEAIARARFEAEAPKYKKPLASELKPATAFWPAEKYHQQYLAKGGRFGTPQSAEKGATDPIRCYG